ALKLGATDFVEKPPTAERILIALQNALTLRDLEEERERLREELAQPGNLIGESAAMAELRKLVARAGPSDSVVLVEGETGTGKERVARALRLASGRKGRFVAVNCAAIPAQLLESELFGAEKGAFTGATARRIGRFEQAQGGTLLLDEIGELPLELQAKLLRVLEQREVERLGGTAPVPVDLRVVAATPGRGTCASCAISSSASTFCAIPDRSSSMKTRPRSSGRRQEDPRPASMASGRSRTASCARKPSAEF